MFEKLKELIFGTGSQQVVKNGFIATPDGNIAIVIDGFSYSVGKNHINYDNIKARVFADEFEGLEDLINIRKAISSQTNGLIAVDSNDVVTYNGKEVHGVVANLIVAHFKVGVGFSALARFLENTMLNPEPRAVDELYTFLEHGGFPLTHDGCFLAYKVVRHDFTDLHTQTFDNRVGACNSMPYKDVDNNRNVACSQGFHVGTHEYATSFAPGNPVVMVKVNPKDAVSVPADHGCEKLRVCEYLVVALCDHKIDDPLVAFEDAPRLNMQIEPATGRRRGAGGRFLPMGV